MVLAGCANEGTVGGSTPASGHSSTPTSASSSAHSSASPSALAKHPSQPLNGTQLSALITPPNGFTLAAASSSDSGTTVMAPNNREIDPTTITCSDWWTGQGRFSAGDLSYTKRIFNGTAKDWVSVMVSIFPDGTATGIADNSVAIMKRCGHFTYTDHASSAQYLVDMHSGADMKAGDRAWTFEATQKATDGRVFPVQITYVQAGDAFVVLTTGGDATPAPVPDRASLPIATWIGALQAAGY